MEGPVDSDFGTRIHFHAVSKVYIARFSRWCDFFVTLFFRQCVFYCVTEHTNIEIIYQSDCFFAGVCDFFGFVKESGSPGLVCHDLV